MAFRKNDNTTFQCCFTSLFLLLVINLIITEHLSDFSGDTELVTPSNHQKAEGNIFLHLTHSQLSLHSSQYRKVMKHPAAIFNIFSNIDPVLCDY